MKAEKVILSFIAILIGLLVAGGAFYLYQTTKVSPDTKKIITNTILPTPTTAPLDNSYLTIDTPKDESVSNKRAITISGKTKSDATIIVSSEDSDQVAKPSADGSYTLTHTIGDGTSVIMVTAIFSDGSEKTLQRTVTFSTESF